MATTRTFLEDRRSTVLPVLALLVVLLAVSPGTADAGETDTFRFQPYPLEVQGEERRSFRVSPEPRGTVSDSVLLVNKSSEVRSFRVYAASATVTDSGVQIPPAHAEPTGIARWIDVERSDIGLLPGTEEVIGFSLTRPPDQPAQGTAAIVAEELVDSEGEPGIDVAYRIAILIEVAGEAAWLRVTDPHLELPIALVPEGGTAHATLSNDTLGTVEADVTWEIESLTGRVWELEGSAVELEPGESKAVAADWSTAPRWGGTYRVNVEATWSAGTVAARGPRTFYPPLWLLTLVILGLGIRGLREMRARRRESGEASAEPAPDPDALRRRLIEAALWLHPAGQDAPRELRETTAAEAQAVAAEAQRTKGASDIEQAARSLAMFAGGLEDGDGSAKKAAHDFDEWFRQHRDDPRIKELVGA